MIVIVVGVPSSLSLTFKSATTTCVVLPGLNCTASVLSSAKGCLLIPKLISGIFSLSTSTTITPSAVPSKPTRPMFSPSALFQPSANAGEVVFKIFVKIIV